MPGLSGFRDNETGDARANVVTPPPTLVNLVANGSLATVWLEKRVRKVVYFPIFMNLELLFC